MVEKCLLPEQKKEIVRGIIVPVIKYDTHGRPCLYVIKHNDYVERDKHVTAGEIGLLSETFETDSESWRIALVRCLSDELDLVEKEIICILLNFKPIDRFSHSFSPKIPNGNGYDEEAKYNEYFYRPKGLGEVITMFDGSVSGVLPTGRIETREVETADYIPYNEIFSPDMKIRQSYNMRIVIAEMEARGVL